MTTAAKTQHSHHGDPRVKRSRAGGSYYRIGFLAALLISIAGFLEPAIADPVYIKDESSVETSLRQPSSGGSLVIRGTRPPLASQPRVNARPGNMAPITGRFPIGSYIEPVVTGNGWDARYNYRGLETTTWPR